MWFRPRQDSDLQAEIEAHIHLEADRLIAEGMSPAEAQDAARRTFGNVALVQEKFYESRRWLVWEHLIRDLRYGSRMLWKSPAFTVAAAVTIALGVGANTAIFSLVDTVLLRSLPIEKPKELVLINSAGNSPRSGAAPYPCLARLPDSTPSFTGLAIFATDETRIEIDGMPEQVFGQVASGNYFDLIGVKPALGRLLNAQDEKLNPPIAVIGDRYWQRRFHRDPAVIGRSITVGNRTFTIAGVTPPEFVGLEPGRSVDVTTPIDTARSLEAYSGPWWFDVVARLKPGVSAIQAQAASDVAFAACMGDSGDSRLAVQPAAHGIDTLRRRFSAPLYALTGIVLLLLLLATVNVANLLLARGIGRSREFAIRLATGAGLVHLIRQLFTETLLLFALGAIPGIILGSWGVIAAEAMFAQGRRPITLDANLNWRVLAFSLVVTVVAALLASLFPVWSAFRRNPGRAIREGQARTSESRGSAAWMRTLVGFQVATSLVLLVGAITFVRTLANLSNVDPGFRNHDVLTMSIELPERSAGADNSTVWRRILEAVRGTPGIVRAGLCVFTPLSGRNTTAEVRMRGYQPARPGENTIRVNHVSEGYFETLGIELLRGRLLTSRDVEDALKVALINETAARLYFAGRDPIGLPLAFPRSGAADNTYRFVGIVRDTKHRNLREPSPRFAFLPIRQPGDAYRRLTLVIASGASDGPIDAIRSRLVGVQPGLLISEVITMRGQLHSTLLTERLLAGLSSVFAGLALILASVGLYGVLSYRIGQQRQSIGIRMALGAPPSEVVISVLRQSGRVIAVGLLCGLPAAFLTARTADSMLWGVKSSDASTYVTGVAILCLAGFLSAWLPARRASAIEPAEALRDG